MTDATSEQIEQLIKECHGCSTHRAVNLLQLCENDVDKAVAKFKQLESMIQVEATNEPTGSASTNTVINQGSSLMGERGEDESPLSETQLPRLPVPAASPVKGGDDGSGTFELEKLLGAIQAGESADKVQDYLGHYEEGVLKANLNASVYGYPAIFYVVATQKPSLIRHWIKYGGDPNATCGPARLPLLAFSILQATDKAGAGAGLLDSCETVKTLLRLGADADVIPAAFYADCSRELPADGPAEADWAKEENKQWCTAEMSRRLTQSLNLTQRYLLHRAGDGLQSGRVKDLVVRQDAEEVLGLHYMIIAQTVASRWLKRKLLVYLARQSKKPLVLVFAGPSGHGKTELAQRFGQLMSLDLQPVDCTIVRQEMELFGPRRPFHGYEQGSPLNNFLVEHSGRRCVVFLDEFEKTGPEIHNSLLLPFQDGRYEDRRNGTMHDSSKTIWILATNKLDESIHAFCRKNEESLFRRGNEMGKDKLVEKLCRQLRKEFITHFGAPLAGRVTEVLPFLVFAPDEQAVVAHKVFMDFAAEVARPVTLSTNVKNDRYLGDVSIDVRRDTVVFGNIARDEYVKELGARGIANGVERTLCDPLTTLYLQDGDVLSEDQGTTRFVIDLNVDGDVEVRLGSGGQGRDGDKDDDQEQL